MLYFPCRIIIIMLSATCSSKLCDKAATGRGPYSELNLCEEHLRRDVRLVQSKKRSLISKLKAVMNCKNKNQLRAEKNSLEAELNELNRAFDALQAKVQHWRELTTAQVQEVCNSFAVRLNDAAEAEKCLEEVENVSNTGDARQMMQLNVSMRLWVDEARDRLTAFHRLRWKICCRQRADITATGSAKLGLRSVGDVSSCVQNLQLVIDRSMANIMKQCYLEDNPRKESLKEVSTLCMSKNCINDLPGQPCSLTSCTKTVGFVGNDSGCIIRSEHASGDCVPLPEPCIFVAFSNDTAEAVDYLLALSLDGIVRFRCELSIDCRDVNALRCDSERQLLIVLHHSALVLADLSGQVVRLVDSYLLEHELLLGVDHYKDDLFTLNSNGQIITLDKDRGIQKSELKFSRHFTDLGDVFNIASCGSKVILLNRVTCRLIVLCPISNQVVNWFPKERLGKNSLQCPWNVAVDKRGIMYIADYESNSVLALSTDGSVLQILGDDGLQGNDEYSFNGPNDLTIIEHSEESVLAVSDEQNCRIRLFKIN